MAAGRDRVKELEDMVKELQLENQRLSRKFDTSANISNIVSDTDSSSVRTIEEEDPVKDLIHLSDMEDEEDDVWYVYIL